MRSIKLNEFIQVVKPQYVYLRLKPSNSIRNHNTHKIARAIGTLYKNVWDSIKREQEKVIRVLGKDFIIPTKISLQLAGKVGYYIYMENKKVEFYFVIPKQHLTFMREKLGSTWNDVTIEEVEEIPIFEDQATKYQLVYKKEDGLSLAVDRRSNDLLCSNLNIVEVLEEGDRVGIFYNFIPSSQYGWKYQYQSTIEKVKRSKPVDRDKVGFLYILKIVMLMIDDLMNSVAGSMGKQQNAEQSTNILITVLDRLNGGKTISESTVKKRNSMVISTQIIVLSESPDKVRERNNARSLASSFDMISQDNELDHKSLRSKVRFTDYSLGAERIKIGDEEAQNFITLAGRDVLERYNFIEKIETHETEVPEDLRSGVMCIGKNRFRGHDQLAYLSNDREFRNLLTLLIGPSRAGKSNLICNMAIDAIVAGECVIVFDFIENCELSDEVAKQFPKDKILQIRCDNGLEGLGYNEVGMSTDTFKQYENAKRQTSNMMTLVNSINTDESRLSPKMERYLESASLVVFISRGSIRDVFNVLQNHITRATFLNEVPRTQHDNLFEYMDSLRELDDLSKDGQIIGTKTSSIVGIIDRLHMLKRNTYMELMLKKDCKQNVNLAEEMQKSQLITIKMPQHMFTTDSERDIYTTYWITKIWLALQVRADQIRDKSQRLKVNLVIDELYQVNYTEQFMTSKLSQMAKFICKPIISCHYINQLRYMRDELRSANTSYMLLAGCDKKNYDELKNELYPFTDEDLRNLPRYHSMNYIKSQEGYARFITKLPGEVSIRSARS